MVEKQREILIGLHLPTQLRDNIEREEFLLLSVKIKERGGNRDWFLEDFGQPIWGVEVEEEKIGRHYLTWKVKTN